MNLIQGFVRSFGALLVLSCLASGAALAAPNLIVYQESADPNPVAAQVVANFQALTISNNLSKHYDHIDVLGPSRSSVDALVAQIQKRSAKRDVDVILLLAGAAQGLELPQGAFRRLRFVYVAGPGASRVAETWRQAGARETLAHADSKTFNSFFFPRFMRLWGEEMENARSGHSTLGATDIATRAAERAARDADDSLRAVAPFLKSETPALDSGYRFSVIQPETTQRTYRHTDFQKLSIGLMKALLPLASIDERKVPSAQSFLDQTGDVAWKSLQDSFPNPVEIPGMVGIGEGEEVWLDGETLRYLIGPVEKWGGPKLQDVLDRLDGVWLYRDADSLHVSAYFNEAFTVSIQDRGAAKKWELYAVEVPRTVRFRWKMADGVLRISGLNEGVEVLNFLAKLPWYLPDTIYLRKAAFSLVDGTFRVEAGVLGDNVSVVASGELKAGKVDGAVDIWESIKRNLRFLIWPSFLFEEE